MFQNALSAAYDGGDREYVPVVELSGSAARRKSGSMFRKHRKTPSSPARLVTPMLGHKATLRSELEAAGSEECTPLSAESAEKLNLEEQLEVGGLAEIIFRNTVEEFKV